MTDQPPQNGNGRGIWGAVTALVRGIAGQPAVASLFGVLVVLLAVVYAIASDERRTSHQELQLMLDRCFPNLVHNQKAPD